MFKVTPSASGEQESRLSLSHLLSISHGDMINWGRPDTCMSPLVKVFIPRWGPRNQVLEVLTVVERCSEVQRIQATVYMLADFKLLPFLQGLSLAMLPCPQVLRALNSGIRLFKKLAFTGFLLCL